MGFILFFFFLGERFLIFGYIEMLTVMNVTVNIYVYMYNLGVFFFVLAQCKLAVQKCES